MYLLFFSLDNLDQNFMLSLSNAFLSYFLNIDIQNLFYSRFGFKYLPGPNAIFSTFFSSFFPLILILFLCSSISFFSYSFLPLLPSSTSILSTFLSFLPSFFGFLLYFSVFLVAITFLISFVPLLQTHTICVYFNQPLISLSGCSHVSGRTKRACCL